MAYEICGPGDMITLTAASDLSSSAKKVLKVGANDYSCDLATDATAPIIGVCRKPAASGAAVGVQHSGVAICIASTAITKGQQLIPAATGKVAPVGALAVGLKYTLGIALEDAAGDGSELSVLLKPGTINTASS